jgi:hypothetical protein
MGNWSSSNRRPRQKPSGVFLGKGYTVRASVGHVRDLLKSQLSVDVDNNFTPKYRVPNEKKEVVKELKKLAKKPRKSISPPTPTAKANPFRGI